MSDPSRKVKPANKTHAGSDKTPQQFMTASVLGMAWQLAVAVLLPLLGGHWLDRTFNTLPYLTLTGLMVGMAGMILVVRRSLSDLNEYMNETKENNS